MRRGGRERKEGKREEEEVRAYGEGGVERGRRKTVRERMMMQKYKGWRGNIFENGKERKRKRGKEGGKREGKKREGGGDERTDSKATRTPPFFFNTFEDRCCRREPDSKERTRDTGTGRPTLRASPHAT